MPKEHTVPLAAPSSRRAASIRGPASVVLVRHGQSLWNEAGLIQGQDGPGLTAVGKLQAEATAQHLLEAYPDAAAIVRSDLQRVAETAAPYEAASGLPITTDMRLREIDKGTWSGRPRAEVEAEEAETMAAIRRGEDLPRGGGESVGDLRRRVVLAFQDVVRKALELSDSGPVIVFSHRGPLRIGIADVLGIGEGEQSRLKHPAQCSLSVLEAERTEGDAFRVGLVGYNRVGHLTALGLGPTRTEKDDE